MHLFPNALSSYSMSSLVIIFRDHSAWESCRSVNNHISFAVINIIYSKSFFAVINVMIIYLERWQLLPKSSNNHNRCENFGDHLSSQNSWLSRWAALKNEAGCHRRQESYLMTLLEGFHKLVSFITIIKIVRIVDCHQNCQHLQLSAKLSSSSIVIKIVIMVREGCR